MALTVCWLREEQERLSENKNKNLRAGCRENGCWGSSAQVTAQVGLSSGVSERAEVNDTLLGTAGHGVQKDPTSVKDSISSSREEGEEVTREGPRQHTIRMRCRWQRRRLRYLSLGLQPCSERFRILPHLLDNGQCSAWPASNSAYGRHPGR